MSKLRKLICDGLTLQEFIEKNNLEKIDFEVFDFDTHHYCQRLSKKRLGMYVSHVDYYSDKAPINIWITEHPIIFHKFTKEDKKRSLKCNRKKVSKKKYKELYEVLGKGSSKGSSKR